MFSQLPTIYHKLTCIQKKVGVVAKDVPSGPLVTEWKAAYSEISKDVEEVDITPAVSAALIVKDEKELVRCKR